MLVDEGAELTAWVQGFEAIRATVSTLEREFRSGMPLAGESASEFHGLQRHKALLGEGPLREHLSLYYREVVQGILVDDLLARIIARYDEAFYLSAAMGNLLDDGEMAEFLPILTSSYENFLVLKDYFVLACTKGLEEWPLAVSRR